MKADEYLDLVKTSTPVIEHCDWTVYNKKLCIVYTEFRKLDIVPYNLYNIAKVYGNKGYNLKILCSGENIDFINEIVKGWKNVEIHKLSENNINVGQFNIIFTDVEFYKMFNGYEFILINQWDSYIFKTIPDEYFQYDYVGAPWNHTYVVKKTGSVFVKCATGCGCGQCHLKGGVIEDGDRIVKVGNGGFSLRKVSCMLDIFSKVSPTPSNEDVIVSLNCKNLPSVEVAQGFSVEHLKYSDTPVGCHKIWENQDDEYIKKLFSCIN